jgi:putative transposase
MGWNQLLAYMTGSVGQELLLRNEYLVAENRLLWQQMTSRVRLSDGEGKTLAEIGKKLGRPSRWSRPSRWQQATTGLHIPRTFNV